MIRLEYRGLQKKTKKNVNCTNPKFYEVLKFPLKGGGHSKVAMNSQEDEDALTVQVVYVEQRDTWRVISQERIRLGQFRDQLVHQQFVTMPIFHTPVIVDSVVFKNSKEISDFGSSGDDDEKVVSHEKVGPP